MGRELIKEGPAMCAGDGVGEGGAVWGIYLRLIHPIVPA